MELHVHPRRWAWHPSIHEKGKRVQCSATPGRTWLHHIAVLLTYAAIILCARPTAASLMMEAEKPVAAADDADSDATPEKEKPGLPVSQKEQARREGMLS